MMEPVNEPLPKSDTPANTELVERLREDHLEPQLERIVELGPDDERVVDLDDDGTEL